MNTPTWYGSIGLVHAAPSPWKQFLRRIMKQAAGRTFLLGGQRQRRRDRRRLNRPAPVAGLRLE